MAIDPESSVELIRRARDGDSDALERLLERYRARLRRWATGRLPRYARQMTDTEDLVQDVLIGTVRNLKSFEDRGEWALQAYLRRAVSNRINDELRKHASTPRREEVPDDLASAHPSPLQAAVGSQAFERYERELENLSPVEREAVIARLELGCSYEEIAALTGRSTSDAARMLVSRALKKLAAGMAGGGARLTSER